MARLKEEPKWVIDYNHYVEITRTPGCIKFQTITIPKKILLGIEKDRDKTKQTK